MRLVLWIAGAAVLQTLQTQSSLPTLYALSTSSLKLLKCNIEKVYNKILASFSFFDFKKGVGEADMIDASFSQLSFLLKHRHNVLSYGNHLGAMRRGHETF